MKHEQEQEYETGGLEGVHNSLANGQYVCTPVDGRTELSRLIKAILNFGVFKMFKKRLL